MVLVWNSVAAAADASTDAASANDGAVEAASADDAASTGDATDDGATVEAGSAAIVRSQSGDTCAISGALGGGSPGGVLAAASFAIAALLCARRSLRRAYVRA